MTTVKTKHCAACVPQSDIKECCVYGSSCVVWQQDGSAGRQRSCAGATSDDAPDANPESQSQTGPQTCQRSLVTGKLKLNTDAGGGMIIDLTI